MLRQSLGGFFHSSYSDEDDVEDLSLIDFASILALGASWKRIHSC